MIDFLFADVPSGLNVEIRTGDSFVPWISFNINASEKTDPSAKKI